MINNNLFDQPLGLSFGPNYTFHFEFDQPAQLNRITFDYWAGPCSQWQLFFQGPPKTVAARLNSGERYEWTMNAADFAFAADFHRVTIDLPFTDAPVTDGLELDIIDAFTEADSPCFRASNISWIWDIKVFGEPRIKSALPLEISQAAYNPSTRMFSFQTNRPARGGLTYYGIVDFRDGKPYYGLKSSGLESSLTSSHAIALGDDFVSGYVILTSVDVDGNTAQWIPDDLLHDANLVGVPYQSQGFGFLLHAKEHFGPFLMNEGLGASMQFAYLWISDMNFPTDPNSTDTTNLDDIENRLRVG